MSRYDRDALFEVQMAIVVALFGFYRIESRRNIGAPIKTQRAFKVPLS